MARAEERNLFRGDQAVGALFTFFVTDANGHAEHCAFRPDRRLERFSSRQGLMYARIRMRCRLPCARRRDPKAPWRHGQDGMRQRNAASVVFSGESLAHEVSVRRRGSVSGVVAVELANDPLSESFELELPLVLATFSWLLPNRLRERIGGAERGNERYES